jgi:putative membrane protein
VEFLGRLAIAAAVNAVSLAVAAWVFAGVRVDGWGGLIVGGIVLGIVNTLVRPVVTFLALPLILLTFGVALFFVSMLMIALTDWVVNGLEISGFWTLVGATIVVWLVNLALASAFGVRTHGRRRRRFR